METKARGNRSATNVATKQQDGNSAVELFIPESVPLLKDATANECAEAVAKGHEISELGGKMSILGALIAGVALIKAKPLIDHGHFGHWKKTHFPKIKTTMLHYYTEYVDIVFKEAAKANFQRVENFDFSDPVKFNLPAKGDRAQWESLYKIIHVATKGASVTGLLRAQGIIRDAKKGGLMVERDADGKLIRARRRTKAELEHEQAVKEATASAKALKRAVEKWLVEKPFVFVEDGDLILDVRDALHDLHHAVAHSCAQRKVKRGTSAVTDRGHNSSKDGEQ